ncbi:hypothetical protein JHK82_052261 [Glycine max]|nr:hypothetical protein JHK86_052091 [Glycine max]KAG5082100.1 hypothetical protein JHK84_052138 [Glycine max]KAG5084864.1 hypothetical protein JHK82_052261 [Glycine max]
MEKAEIAKVDEDQKKSKIKKRSLPHGTSEYQAAWIVDDSDEGSDYDNENDDGMVLDEGEDRSSGQEENKYSEFDCDRASLILGDSDKETNNDSVMMEEWRVKMTPIQALFLKCHPVIHITAKCISETDDYPPEIPGHITKFLETRVEFPDLNADFVPPGFNINARGALYLEREGRHHWMKNQLDINVNLALPPLLAWVPEDVLLNILQSVRITLLA